MTMKTIFKAIFVFCVAMVISQSMQAQKAKHKLANRYYETYDFKMASEIYKDILSNAKYAKDTLALRQVANCEMKRGQWINAEGYYKQLIETGAAKSSDLHTLAEAQKLQGKLNDALETYKKILALNPSDEIAKNYVENPEFAVRVMRDSTIYTLRNCDINTNASDFAPGFFVNGKIIYSSAKGTSQKNQRIYNWTEQPYLNVYSADINPADSALTNPGLIQNSVNSRYHEGTMTYDPGTNMVYLTRNNFLRGGLKKSKKGKLNLGIYSTKYSTTDQQFESLEPFVHNNKEYSVGHPAFNGSRNRLYVVSDKPGGMGGTDIYYCERQGETWGPMINMGKKINTSANEMFPFFVGDSTLYFSSNGHLSIGGMDVYYTNPFDTLPVRNVGYPANSRYDDFAMICYPGETVGYFSSNRRGGKGDDDIYLYHLHPPTEINVSGVVKDLITLQPIPNAIVTLPAEDGSTIQATTNERGEYNIKVPYKPVITLEANKQGYLPGKSSAKTDPRSAYVEGLDITLQKIDYMTTGKVLYDKDGTPAPGALVELFEINGKDTTKLDSVIIGKTGTYMFPLMKNKKYFTVASKDGYSRMTENISTNDPNNKVHTRDFRLFSLEKGTVVRLDNIYYDYNSDVITPAAAKELDKLVTIMKDNPAMRIELSSHSDSRGGDDYNLKLSDRRAKSAVKYIESQGIAGTRMIAKGYGEQKILNHCKNGVTCTDAEHGFNRRTEFTIL